MEVAIAQNGRIVYDRAFGAATLDTRFPIASITKMFTAVAIMQLVQANRVDLDASVSKYLPSAPYADRITVRQLLQHTSGLWNYGDYAFNTGLVAQADDARGDTRDGRPASLDVGARNEVRLQ